MNVTRDHWLKISSAFRIRSEMLPQLSGELHGNEKLVQFFLGDFALGNDLASTLLTEGDLIPLLSPRQFIVLFYDLLKNINSDTPSYVAAMILRKFKDVLQNDLATQEWLNNIDEKLKIEVLSMVKAATIHAWEDIKRREKLLEELRGLFRLNLFKEIATETNSVELEK